MPHILVTHTKGYEDLMPTLLPALAETLEGQGFPLQNVRSYSTPLSHAVVGGKNGAEMMHITFRLLDKPDRTPEIIKGWLDALLTTAKSHLPEGQSVVGESFFLSETYMVKK